MSREYYRHYRNGDLGYLVYRAGKPFIRLDRHGDEVERTFNPSHWLPEKEQRPLSLMQVAEISHEADSALMRALGMHADTKTWLNMPESARIKWLDKGAPEAHPIRRRLDAAVREALSDLVKT